jgi:hypothetical protein
MTFDNVTLVGVLFTLPCIVLLLVFSRKTARPRHEDRQLFDCLDNEPYRYGT